MQPWARSPQLDVGDDLLFDVYEEPADGSSRAVGQLGVSRSPAGTYIVEGIAGSLQARKVSSEAAVKELAKRLRMGYRHSGGQRFFNPRSQQFCLVHPDMSWKGAKVVLVSRHGGGLVAAADAVATLVRATPAGCISGAEVDAWLEQQRRNAAHVVAFDDHPVWALALAELVYRKGWDWRPGPNLEQPPSGRPCAEPTRWLRWLQHSFSEQAVTAAQAALGWTLEGQFEQATSPAEAVGLSALL